jgi:hypothetical protein
MPSSDPKSGIRAFCSDYSFVTDRLNAMGYLIVSLKDSAGGAILDRAAPVLPQV